MSAEIFHKLARFNSKFHGLRYQNPSLRIRYVLSEKAFEEIRGHATCCGETNGKNYIFGVEFRVDPNIKGIIIAEVIDETY